MKTVNISELKARLSAYIEAIRNGEEVLVCDRNRPVARMVPCHLENYAGQQQRLVASGLLCPPLKQRRAAPQWPMPPGKVSHDVMRQVWRRERDTR